MLNDRRDVRKYQVRRRRAGDNEIDILDVDTRRLDRFFCRLDTHIRCRLIGLDNMAPFNTRAGLDPLIRSIDDLLEIEIGHHPFRQVTPGTNDA